MTHFSVLFKELGSETQHTARGASFEAQLEQRVLAALKRASSLRERRRAYLAWGSLFLLGTLLGTTFVWAGTLLLHSEFWSLLSLFFSDLDVIASSFQDFGLSLLETLPIFPLFALLLPLFLLSITGTLWFSRGERKHPSTLHFSSPFNHLLTH